MKEILIYSALGTLGFAVLNTAWIWLLTKAEAIRTSARSIEKQPATAIMGARVQFEPSGD